MVKGWTRSFVSDQTLQSSQAHSKIQYMIKRQIKWSKLWLKNWGNSFSSNLTKSGRWTRFKDSALDVATTSGSGNEKVFRLTPEHYTIALCNFKRDIKKALLRENGPMTVSHLNYLLYGVDSSVTDCQISDRLKDCHPEITSRWEKSQQFVILSKMNNQE